tara:strand:- start:139 stop:573 length:435 start_codon:yes stop_codon:yes gene_type:complete
MSKHVPEILKDHILPFNWNVTKVWSLNADVDLVSRSRFDYLLDLLLWSSGPGKGMLFDIAPMAVIQNPMASPHQTKRLATTDISYPLDFLMYSGRPWILDGMHRLAKLYVEGSELIEVRFHDAGSISAIAMDQKGSALDVLARR